MAIQRPPWEVPLEEARDREATEQMSTSARAAFWRELHAAAVARWLDRGDNPVLAAMVRHAPARKRARLSLFTPLTETDQVDSMLIALVEAHLRRERPDMAPPTRWRLSWRAAQVGLCRIGFGLTYADMAALPGVDARSVRPLKGDYVLLLDSYMAALRGGGLPPRVDLKALRELLRR